MAMAMVGARGETNAEMATVLDLLLPPDEINAANSALHKSLNTLSSPPLEVRAANALMLARHGDFISADYVAALQKDYGADVLRGGNVRSANAWVRKKTSGKIDSILGRLDPMTALVLIDAVYFKAPGSTPSI